MGLACEWVEKIFRPPDSPGKMPAEEANFFSKLDEKP
jgi:hypothetical protein